MYCQKCGTAYQGGTCPVCQKNIGNKFNNLFVEPDERLEGVLGNNAAKTFISTGVLGNGFAVFTNKRMYFKGKCYTRKGKGFFKNMEERIVDLSDVTGTGFVHNQNLITKILFYIMAILFGILGLNPLFWIIYFATGEKWAFYLALALPLPIPLLFYYLYKAFNYSLFEVSYAGGGIGFDLHWISKSEAAEFQKKLQAAKSRLKSETPVYIVPPTESAKGIPEQIKQYKDLLDSGIITAEEFETKKKQLLGL